MSRAIYRQSCSLAEKLKDSFSGDWGEEAGDTFTKVLRTTNFTNTGVIDYSDVVSRCIDKRKVQRKKLLHGDIIIEKSGGSPSQPVGRVVFFDTDDPTDYVCNNFTAVLRFSEDLYPRFVFHLLFFTYQAGKSEKYQNKTTGIRNLKLVDYLESIDVPDIPLSEQKRIAAILDSADAIRTKRKAAIEKLDQLAQSVFYEMFGDPVMNEKGWKSLPLTEACDLYSGGTPTTTDENLWGNDFPWFSPKDMKGTYLIDSIDHISKKCVSSGKLKLLPERTIAIVVRGMILAHTFPVCCITHRATINQDMKALLPREPIQSDFLLYCLMAQAKHALSLVSVAAHGTTRLDTNALANIPILIPPIESQEDFSQRIGIVQKIKEHSTSASEKEDSLFSSLQHRAFAGEL